MAKVQEAITVGIGAQVDQATVNADVRDATEVVTTVAAPGEATGIFLRSPEDLSKSMERIESEGGTVPGSKSRLSGTLSRVNPTVSFTIDARGNGVATTTPIAGEYTFDEYFERILAGARLDRQTETTALTPYQFGATDANAYHTLKVWRGAGANAESWTLVGCTFNLTWNFTASEKALIDVDVISTEVIYNGSETFPTNDLTTAFGTQTNAAPILKLAGNQLDTVTRGFKTATLSVSYEENEALDCNATNGVISSQGVRTIDWSASYFRDTLSDDFLGLTDDLDGATVGPNVLFELGVKANAGDIANAQRLEIPSLRMSTQDKEDGDSVIRVISGYAVVVGDSGFGSNDNEEFRVIGI